jgi:hypothetical protein
MAGMTEELAPRQRIIDIAAGFIAALPVLIAVISVANP